MNFAPEGNLYRNGYVHDSGVIPSDFVKQLREYCLQQCNGEILPTGEAVTLPVFPDNPLHMRLINYGAAEVEHYSRKHKPVKYLSGAIIPKYPREAQRAWHVDWWNWGSAETRNLIPPIIGALFYLDDTATSGSLRLVPGSHMREVPNHAGCLGTVSLRPDELIIQCRAGDMILLDSRLLHAVTENISQNIRICVTLWFLTCWNSLSGSTKATVMLSMDKNWKPILGDLYPHYDGTAQPVQHVKIPVF